MKSRGGTAVIWCCLVVTALGQEVPTIELDATVRARSIQFDTKPIVEVNAGEWFTEKRNLPDSIQPGRVYRDVEVRTRVETFVKGENLVEPSQPPVTEKEDDQ